MAYNLTIKGEDKDFEKELEELKDFFQVKTNAAAITKAAMSYRKVAGKLDDKDREIQDLRNLVRSYERQKDNLKNALKDFIS
jgi:major membrane immunogen (membrane-anchored lipoprotein)